MSEKSGFFSSVGRFFTGSKAREDDSSTSSSTSPTRTVSAKSPKGATFLKDVLTIDSPEQIANKKNAIRHLSPSVLKLNSTRDLDEDDQPVSDIFSCSSSMSRKRQLTETDRILLPLSVRADGVKRSRFLPNRSLLETSVLSTATGTPKLDTTWAGQFSSTHSPTSSVTNYSLLSKRSRTSNGSNLSSRTQQILRKLEEASTPAKEVQRMSMIRSGLRKSEKWSSNASNSLLSGEAPPLRKSGDNVPSRIQLLSKTMAMSAQRKPYWRDLTRKRSNPTFSQSDSNSTKEEPPKNNTMTTLSSLFSIDSGKEDKTTASSKDSNKQKSIVKGSDGKSIGKNTYKLADSDDEVEPIEENWMSKSKPLTCENSNGPAPGFLNNLSFTFSAPVDASKEKKTVIDNDNSKESNNDDDTSSRSDSDSPPESDSESSESVISSGEEASNDAAKNTKSDTVKPVESRPQTSTDTVSPAISIQPSNNNSPTGSKDEDKQNDTSQKQDQVTVVKSANWTCDACFTSWPENLKECGCCGTSRGGTVSSAPPPQKTLVSNISSFAPAKSGFSFGFGASNKTENPIGLNDKANTEKEVTTKSTDETNLQKIPKPPVSLAPSAPASVPELPASSSIATSVESSSTGSAAVAPSTDRVNWDCPDCMVSNKASDDKCPCCGHVKYKTENSSPDNVFGDRAFKPTSFGTGSMFGTSNKYSFGVSTEKKEEAKIAEQATKETTTASPFVFGIKSTTTSISTPPLNLNSKPIDVPATATVKPPSTSVTGIMFGTSNSLGSTKPAETKNDSQPTTSAVPSIFGQNTAEPPKKDVPLFGKPISSIPAFGNAPKPETTLPTLGFSVKKDESTAGSSSILPSSGTQPIIFGQSNASAEKPIGSLFNSNPTTSSADKPFSSGSLFGKPTDATAAAPAPAPAPSGSIFGQTTGSIFETTTTDGSVSAKKRMFTSDSSKPSIFSMDKPAAATGANDNSSPFQFGASKPFAFGQPSSTQTTSFGAAPAIQPTLSSNSSTGSLFGQPTDQKNTFQPPALSNGAFSFGANAAPAAGPSSGSSNGGVFVFGGSNTSAPPAPTVTATPFQFGTSTNLGTENAFAYNPQATTSSGRKMALARRRINRR